MSLLRCTSAAVLLGRRVRPPLPICPGRSASAAAKGDCGDGSGKSAGASGPPFPVHEGYLKLKQKQIEYSRPDGKPVWLKRPTDAMLFGMTWALIFVAVSMQFSMLYEMAMPKK